MRRYAAYDQISASACSFCLRVASLSVFFFFFSSRRRHTRFDCDWSSDVCSSDLVAHLPRGAPAARSSGGKPYGFDRSLEGRVAERHVEVSLSAGEVEAHAPLEARHHLGDERAIQRDQFRSEERRLGKEGRDGSWL